MQVDSARPASDVLYDDSKMQLACTLHVAGAIQNEQSPAVGTEGGLAEVFEAALPVLLLHDSFRKCKTVCSLLCSSKALRAALHKYCHGLVHIKVSLDSIEQARQLGDFFMHNGHIVSSLWLTYSDRDAEAALAAGLQSAASGKTCLQLKSFRHSVQESSPALLHALSNQKLTRLRLSFVAARGATDSSRVAQAAAALTNLCSLELDNWVESCDTAATQFLPSLSSLVRLTELTLGLVEQLETLQYLPVHLRSLLIRIIGHHDSSHTLQLQHLTALSRLSISDDKRSDASWRQEDQYPVNLRVLSLGLDVPLLEQLHPLRKLELLELHKVVQSSAELKELSRCLVSLREVKLHHLPVEDSPEALLSADAVVSAAAAGWPELPLVALSFSTWSVATTTIHQLSRLHGLTMLSIAAGSLDVTPRMLAQQLQKLTELRQLSLGWFGLLPDSSDAAALDMSAAAAVRSATQEADGYTTATRMTAHASTCATAALVRVIAGIPQLTELTLSRLQLPGLGGRAVTELVAAENIQSLTLTACGLTDQALTTVLVGTTRLKRLNIEENTSITDASLHAIAQLPHLELVSVRQTSVTGAALMSFKRQILQKLPQCRVLHWGGPIGQQTAGWLGGSL